MQVGTGGTTVGSLSATTITAESGGTLQLQNSSSSIVATDIFIESGGGLNWFGGTIDISGGSLNSESNISMGSYGTCTLQADLSSIEADTFTIGTLGSLYGTCWSYVDSFTNHGTIYAGCSYSYTKIYGNYTQSSTGTLVCDFLSDTDYRWLIVDNSSTAVGTSDISGTVRLVNTTSYTPTYGDDSEVLKNYEGLHTGNFDTVEVIDFSAGISFYQSSDASGCSVVASFTPIHFVDADNTSGDGTSWANAFPTLQEALAVVNSGEQIWIAEGTYTPGNNRTDTFSMPHFAVCYGGFEGTESSIEQRDIEAHPTILSGDIGVADEDSDNVYHVVTIPGEYISFIDGVTIVDGYANGTGIHENGGGIYQGNSSYLALINCSVIDNFAKDLGGGVYSTNGSTYYSQCLIDHNKAVRGGGVYAYGTGITIDQIDFTSNRVNTFDSVVGVYGGGLYIDAGSINVTNSTFFDNDASYGVGLIGQGTGGAIYAKECDTVVSGTTFEQNSAISGGATTRSELRIERCELPLCK